MQRGTYVNYKLKSPRPFAWAVALWKSSIWWQNPRHKVAPSLMWLFCHRFWLRLMLLIASLSVDFCWDEPFEPNPWDISDSEDDEKGFLMASQMAETSHQIGGGPLRGHFQSKISIIDVKSWTPSPPLSITAKVADSYGPHKCNLSNQNIPWVIHGKRLSHLFHGSFMGDI